MKTSDSTTYPTTSDITALRRKLIRRFPDARIRKERKLRQLSVTVGEKAERTFCLIIWNGERWLLGPEQGFPLNEFLKLSKLIESND